PSLPYTTLFRSRVADLAPMRVGAILLAAPGVASGRLQVATRVGTDPNIAPGGRDGETLDPADGFRVPDGAAAAIDVGEPLPDPLPPQARRLVGYVAQPRSPSRRHRVNQLRRIGRQARLPGLR